jgi:hypothetical protein
LFPVNYYKEVVIAMNFTAVKGVIHKIAAILRIVAIRGITAKFTRASLPGAVRPDRSYAPEVGRRRKAGSADFTLECLPFIPDTGNQVDPGSPSVKAKFGITANGKDGVTAVFTVLNAYIKAGGLSLPDTVIKPGDYIDLEGDLEVGTYKGEGYLKETNRDLGIKGRLIVVGINSFHSGRGTKATGGTTVNENVNGRYAGMGNDDVPHVVFQFQNIPVLRRMNADGDNAGGYAASEMRRYLVDVDGDGTGGAFLAGLRTAGVPEAVMWAPARYVSTRGNGNTILRDPLWLPTERELFGRIPRGLLRADDETMANQARLEYYLNAEIREKFNTDGWMHYWTASPAKDKPLFCIVNDCGDLMSAVANMELGCVPAFCVQ